MTLGNLVEPGGNVESHSTGLILGFSIPGSAHHGLAGSISFKPLSNTKRMPPANPNTFEHARQLISRGKTEQAGRMIKQLMRQAPESAEGYHLLGLLEYQKRQFSEAVRLISKAVIIDPHDPVIRNNSGLALLANGQVNQAIESFSVAIDLEQNNADTWFNRGNAFREMGRHDDARRDYLKALAIDPFLADAHNNLGLSYRHSGETDLAVEQFELCLQILPDHPYALNNLGLAKQALGDTDTAKSLFEKALKAVPDYPEAHINLAHLSQEFNDYVKATEHYLVAYKQVPELDLLAGDLAQSKAMICDWHNLDALWAQIEKRIQKGAVACSPFVLLSGLDRPDLSLKLAAHYAAKHVPSLDVPVFTPPTKRDPSRKLRIGYLSSDFKEHPVAYLTVGIIENHCRNDVELFGFAIGQAGDGPLGRRIRAGFDHFVDVSGQTDAQAVQTIRSFGLDIAMDITGYTAGCRPSILKARVAPVQVNYYGYAGTMGADFIDYIVGDAYLMPPGSEVYYQEKIIYMPECHQPNDDQRPISDVSTTRADHGLPDKGFVYCCFNKPYKILPKVFDSWMRILKAVKHSVLWLQSTDQTVMQNLRLAAKKSGIDPERLIFAGRTPTTSEHLARYKHADLFLDTYPYTAHTTANDALWAGLPVLGLSGKTFAARVSESLLSTLGLPDLVMRDLREFESKAIDIGSNPAQLVEYRERLERGKSNSSLYKPAQLARWLEQGLRSAFDRYENGLQPEHIVIAR